MYKSTLINQLKTYTPKEIKEFSEYIRSPYFNKNHSVIKLFDYIKKQYPEFNEMKLEKELTYRKIFPNAEYNDGFMRTIMFNLAKLADDYLSQKLYKQNYFLDKWFLLQELNDRMLDKQIEKNIKEISAEFSKVNILEADYFLNKFLIDNERWYYLNRLNLDKIDKFSYSENIESMFNELTNYYLLRAFKLFDFYTNAREIYNIKFNAGIFEDILKNLKPEAYKDVPVISLYYNIAMLHFLPDDTSYYFKIKKQAAEIESKINRYEIANTYINLENYCKKRIRLGDNSFLHELLDILKIEIQKKIHIVSGYISAKFYRCVVDTALKLNEKEWAYEFMRNSKNKLSPDDMENTYYFSLALYEFSLNNFHNSLEYLSKVKYDEVYQKIEMRCLMAQLFYELGMDESLFSLIDSFRHFLCYSKQLPEDRKLYFGNFIKFLKSLLNLKNCFNYYDSGLIRKSILKEKLVYNKEWLLEKIDEIKLV